MTHAPPTFTHPWAHPMIGLYTLTMGPVLLAVAFAPSMIGVSRGLAFFVGSLVFLCYLGVLAVGAARGSIRRMFVYSDPAWGVMMVAPLLLMTFCLVCYGWFWLGFSAFGNTSGSIMLAIGLVVFTSFSALLLRRKAVIDRGRNRMCANCGYDRKGDLWTPCPECGYAEEPVEEAA